MSEVEDLLLSVNPFERRMGLGQLSWRAKFLSTPGAKTLVTSMIRDEDKEVREAALHAICQNLEYFENPTFILKQFIDDPEWEIQMNAGNAVATELRRISGPEMALKEVATLDPEKYWPVHVGIQILFRLEKDWFRQSEDATNYVQACFYGHYRKEMRSAALDTICRCLPYQDNRMISAIKAAIEDEDPEVRSQGKMFREAWIMKDTVVKNSCNNPV